MTGASYSDYSALPAIKTIEVEPVFIEYETNWRDPDYGAFYVSPVKRIQIGSVLTLTLANGTVLKFGAPMLGGRR